MLCSLVGSNGQLALATNHTDNIKPVIASEQSQIIIVIHVHFPAQQSPTSAPTSPVLPYISLGTTDGVEMEYVGHFDDGVSHAIHIPDGFPFGTFLHSSVYVSLSLHTLSPGLYEHMTETRNPAYMIRKSVDFIYDTVTFVPPMHDFANELLPPFSTNK